MNAPADDEHLKRAIEAAIAAKWTGISDFDLAGAHWETDGPGPHEIRVDGLINLVAMVKAVIEIDRRGLAAEIKTFLAHYPTPWTQESDGMLRAANGTRVWDVADANDDSDLAGAIMRLVNQIGEPQR